MKTSRRNSHALVAVCTAAMLMWTAGAGAQDAPVLVGTWTLNMDKTEPARDRVIEDPEGTGSTVRTGLGGRRRGGSGGGGETSGGARGGGGGGRGNMRLIFGGMMMASSTLKIMQADSIVTIENEEGPLFLNLKANNKPLEEPLANQTILRTKAQWRRNELVIERSHDSEGSARLIMRIDPKNPKVLTVDFHYEHKRQRRTIDQRRVYEAAM